MVVHSERNGTRPCSVPLYSPDLLPCGSMLARRSLAYLLVVCVVVVGGGGGVGVGVIVVGVTHWLAAAI